MNQNKFNNIFNNNPYIQSEDEEHFTKEPEIKIENSENKKEIKSIFIKEDDKEKKMFYLQKSTIKKLEKIANKYNLALSKVVDKIVEEFDKY